MVWRDAKAWDAWRFVVEEFDFLLRCHQREQIGRSLIAWQRRILEGICDCCRDEQAEDDRDCGRHVLSDTRLWVPG